MAISIEGKSFFINGSLCFLKTVTYGPFPPEAPHDIHTDFPKIAKIGFNTVRTYALPDDEMLTAAAENDLHLIPTLPWAHGCDFITDTSLLDHAQQKLTQWLTEYQEHPGLGALLIGNEIPSDMVRWMGPTTVRAALDSLILLAKKIAPHLPVAYSSFPTTEYLEPQYADFTAFNLYLEDPAKIDEYLPRLHHIAGDRPVFLTEFGLDTQSHTEEEQATLLPIALEKSHLAGLAGFTAYAWSDHWFNNGETVQDWSFGLLRRDLSEKPALPALQSTLEQIHKPPLPAQPPKISVIICTRNGASRVASCLKAAKALDYPDYEVLVINDGSTDKTQTILDETDGILAHHLAPCGLSAARNYGAQQASGEIFAYTDDDCQVDPHWLTWIAHTFSTTKHAAIGGPNLPPPTDDAMVAVSATAPGAPTHVMLSDTEAEHLPGCNISIKREAFEKIKGFDPMFRTAGDDVDVCWRLRDAGYTLGFCGAAFVWHDRRSTPWRYLKQQMGYGHAEALLYQKHPKRFTKGGSGGIRWEGWVYTGGALGVQTDDLIYTGPTGSAPYQALIPRTQPIRPIPQKFDTITNRLLLKTLTWLQKYLRPWLRQKHGGPPHCREKPPLLEPSPQITHRLTLTHHEGGGRYDLYKLLLEHGWITSGHPEYDLMRDGIHLFAATEQTGSKTARTFIRLHSQSPIHHIQSLAQSIGFS